VSSCIELSNSLDGGKIARKIYGPVKEEAGE
jgi:hypothetical protein